MENTAPLVWLILLLPLAGAFFNGVVALFVPAVRKEGLIGTVGTAVVAIPFILAVYLFVGFQGEPIVAPFYTWMAAGDLHVEFAYRIDQLSLLMTLIVTGVGALIHLYSAGYMHGDRGYWKFFAYLNLFIFAMLNLVLGNNLVVLFLGWEGVGLCSYLLIGFWYEESSNMEAANKAFIVNRVGDFAFLMAMFVLFHYLGALDFGTILRDGPGLPQGTLNWVVLLLFIGATGKSAQIPLFVWLPDAMAGPTPVSALIHAATMVTSGLYLLARLSPLVLNAPAIMIVIAIVGSLTCIMAATIAITQNDIKKVLAYSTISQLGYMFMSAGVGAFFVAIFHVMTHAFFKACLFLGSGSVIHGMHHVEHDLEHHGVIPSRHVPETPLDSEATQHPLRHNPLPYDGPFDAQDMRTMGGLYRFMPITNVTFLIATLAIAGIPPLAGFFSKDEILSQAFAYGYDGHGYAWFVWIVGLITALITAIYMTRCYVLTFLGKSRWPEAEKVHPHESPWTMTLPLIVLGLLSVVGGFLGLPHLFNWPSWIHHWLVGSAGEAGPVAQAVVGPFPEQYELIEILLIIVGALVAIVGVFFAWYRWRRYGVDYDATVRRRFGALYRWWERKYYWDEAYQKGVVAPVVEGSREGLAPFDQRVVDGAVNGLAKLAYGAARGLRVVQTGIVQNYAMAVVLGVVLVVALMLFV
ncbi:MAG TPA: NADH-quinone oxidoreductase subunit L [Rhodothermales bacterium]|nr:NADH-quinone oxidoreductase subunit L [Rhodothermales bacterium]